ncbi:MAG: flavin reductase [Lachnospiraceae bacterium]|nr:flavin reductase [Lachnospiraceae bacterium]MDY6221279.1 flavin reductase [Candidatus Alectryocaccobium sp.]
MDNKALFKLSYGIFMLATKDGEKINGCITNTCIQVANDPTRVAISVLNSNYTCDLIKNSGVFAISILDKNCTFDTIKHFGYQSGRDVDKFADINASFDENGIPYLTENVSSVVTGKVLEKHELGTHTLFIAEVTDARMITGEAPLTYDYYQSNVKPKPAAVNAEKKIKAWRCKICGYIYEGSDLPKDFVCPLCGHGAEDFEPVYE